jgi:hypothetical protein
MCAVALAWSSQAMQKPAMLPSGATAARSSAGWYPGIVKVASRHRAVIELVPKTCLCARTYAGTCKGPAKDRSAKPGGARADGTGPRSP